MANVIDFGALSLATEASWYQQRRPDVKLTSYLTFRLGDEEYGIELLRLREIKKMLPTTEVPRVPGFVSGIISVRGIVMPVIDLCERIGLTPIGRDRARYLVVSRNEELFALVVDEVREVVPLSEAEVEPAPPMLARSEAEFISGIGRRASSGERLIILLNLEAVLRFEMRRR